MTNFLYEISVSILLLTCSLGYGLDLEVSAESAVLMDADSGAILFKKEIDKPQYPASITKIVTALLALAENEAFLDEVAEAEWDSVASISTTAKRKSNFSYPPHWLETGATHMGIKKGERLSIRDLLNGMLVSSANDAANVIAHYLGGSIANYMDRVNEYLAELGLTESYFVNPSGLHHPKQITTAYEMALIAREAMKYPYFRQIVAQSYWRRPKTNLQEPTTLAQGNRLMRRGKFYYPAALGIKTGYTQDAKNTFVAAASDGERTLIAVLLRVDKRENMFEDAVALFEAAFAEEKVYKTLIHSGIQSYSLRLPRANRVLQVEAKETIEIGHYPSEEEQFHGEIVWKDDLALPIPVGAEVGEMHIFARGGECLYKVPLYATKEVRQAWVYSLFGDIAGDWIVQRKNETLAVVTLGLGLILIRRRRPRR